MVRLNIARVVIALEADADGPIPAVNGAASAFVVSSGRTDMAVRCVWGDLKYPNGRALFDSGGVWQLHERDDQLLYSFTSPLFSGGPYRQASFDRHFRRGVVTLDRDRFAGRADVGPLEYPLDELMVINRLIFAGGVEIHGCGVVDASGAGYLFAGQSGAGKSTIARLWHNAEATVISDDRVILRLDDNGVTMYGTPWHGDAEFAAPLSVPLTRIFLLCQRPRHAITPLSPGRAAARLFSCAFPVFHDACALDRTLAVLSTIVDQVPVDVIEFAPTPDVIDFVRQESVGSMLGDCGVRIGNVRENVSARIVRS
jgi:hypothetical protein